MLPSWYSLSAISTSACKFPSWCYAEKNTSLLFRWFRFRVSFGFFSEAGFLAGVLVFSSSSSSSWYLLYFIKTDYAQVISRWALDAQDNPEIVAFVKTHEDVTLAISWQSLQLLSMVEVITLNPVDCCTPQAFDLFKHSNDKSSWVRPIFIAPSYLILGM